MAGKEIRWYSRRELLELIVKQEKENAALRGRVRALEAELRERRIRIETAGTMAEAALKLNKVFEAADAAARQYLENLRERSGDTDE